MPQRHVIKYMAARFKKHKNNIPVVVLFLIYIVLTVLSRTRKHSYSTEEQNVTKLIPSFLSSNLP
jgi:hypothetical protein